MGVRGCIGDYLCILTRLCKQGRMCVDSMSIMMFLLRQHLSKSVWLSSIFNNQSICCNSIVTNRSVLLF